VLNIYVKDNLDQKLLSRRMNIAGPLHFVAGKMACAQHLMASCFLTCKSLAALICMVY